MKIDLDIVLMKVAQRAKPQPLTLTIDGGEFTVRAITPAESARLNAIDEHTDADNVAFVKSLFDGPAPETLDAFITETDVEKRAEQIVSFGLVASAIQVNYRECAGLGARMRLSGELIQEQIAAARVAGE